MDDMNKENFEEGFEEEPEMITLSDEDGNQIEMECLDIVEYEGDSYVVMIPAEGGEEDEPDEVVIMQIEPLNDEEDSFSPVDDDDVLNAVFELFKEKFKDEFDFE